MSSMHRILLVDDNPAIHDDYRKILQFSSSSDELDELDKLLFEEDAPAESTLPAFEIDSAMQGQEAFEMSQRALAEGRPYRLAFVDMRMPPGWDGLQTIEHLWEVDPKLQVVICTAFSDYTWSEIVDRIAHRDRLLLLKKPFDNIEVCQLAIALTHKWELERQAENQLAAMVATAEELERRVDERTRQLSVANHELKIEIADRKEAQQQLDENIAALERANRTLARLTQQADAATKAKSAFLANMSHEIRTPMTAILGFADVLLGEEGLDRAPPDRVRALETIQRNGEYLLLLINDILDLSKIEAGKLEVERISCSPVQALSDVASLMQVRAVEKDISLQVEFDSAMPERIQTDPTRFRQILINLVGNAIKFTSQGGVRVVARLVAPHEPSPRLQIDVIDTGIGIAEAQLCQLFQPFTQSDASTTRKFGGTGLGLTISQRLAQLLGGEITVVSQPGAGSTFQFTIETGTLEDVGWIEQPPVNVTTCQPVGRALDDDHPTRVNCRVLLAEDGPDNQRLIAYILKEAGVDVTIVENGKQALDDALSCLHAGNPYEVVLMDMQMPVKDGYTATAELRQAGYEGPIIALTAHAMEGDRQKCLAAGCDDYATKPVDRQSLVAAIAHWAARSPAAAAP